MKLSVLCSAIIFNYMLPSTTYGQCIGDIIGKWQQTHVVFGGKTLNDDSQAWEFMENGSVRLQKTTPEIDVSGDYSCEGDIIYMKGAVPGRLKILEYDGNVMVWESLDHGGGVAHIKKVE
ncbi:MAG: hypothetical protein OEQ39_17805 [Gammaproteobacteria bacterium]|nr:hypothetical protein [Gammaproteobacteria bacterium]MDH3464921.1 hypothetical protein [Gammaproteobacteria bacterium]